MPTNVIVTALRTAERQVQRALRDVRVLLEAAAAAGEPEAALFFDVACAHEPTKLNVGYKLFFAIDPSHRGILVMRSQSNIATSVLSPQNSMIALRL
jgi:hypothetical protein